MVHRGLLQGLNFFLDLFVVHCERSLQVHWGQLFQLQCSWILGLFIRFLPVVPFILHFYVLNHTQLIPLQIPTIPCITIYDTSINLIISVHTSFYNIQYTASFHIAFHTSVFIFIFIFYHIEVSIVSVYLLICFLSQFLQCTTLFSFKWASNL